MVRFLIIVASVLLLLGLPPQVASSWLTSPSVAAADDCACCPDSDDDDGDCCDWDFGACCASGVAAGLPVIASPHADDPWTVPETRSGMALHLLHPRVIGPPPTPPPIG
jgi:hypothetical protein